MKKFIKILLSVLCGLLATVLLVGAFLFYAPDIFENHDDTAVAGATSWMANLDDDLCISQVVLPGAHDAGANHAMLSWFSKCQSTDFATLLNDGIRYLDIRLRVEGDQLVFCHGFCDCTNASWPFGGALTLDDLLTTCYAFLQAHPTEFLVFSVKQEEGDESTEEFQTLFNQYVQQNRIYWYLSDDTLPNVEEARGAIVLTRRFDDALGLGDEAGLYLNWSDQGNRTEQEQSYAQSNVNIYTEKGKQLTVFVQDRYKYDTNEKWAAFMAGVTEYPQIDGQSAEYTLFINFLSTNGNVSFGHPYQYAKDLNEKLLALSDENALQGWIILDFCDATLAQKIWSANYSR